MLPASLIAALAMSLGCASVIANALRLRRARACAQVPLRVAPA